MLTDERKAYTIALCQSLIQKKSYSGEEAEAANVVKEAFNALGYDDVIVDLYGNVMGVLKGKQEGPRLLLDGHIDTVPVKEENWTVDPFGGEIRDGRIYGRGTSDMKGAVSAMISAAAYFAQDCSRNFSGSIIVSCSVHEECFEGIAPRKVSERMQPDYVIIGESSSLQLKRGQRGRAEIVVETFGKPAHSSNPEKGVNAVYQMMKLIQHIQALPLSSHPVLGKGILELTDMISEPYPGASVVPHYCRATFDRRTLVGETWESILSPIEELIAKLGQEDPTFHAAVSYAKGKERCYTGAEIAAERFFPAWLMEDEDPFVQAALQGLKKSGLQPSLTHYAFCTNGSHYAGEAGISTIGFGPSEESLAHTDDEYIETEQLAAATLGYYGIMEALFNGSK